MADSVSDLLWRPPVEAGSDVEERQEGDTNADILPARKRGGLKAPVEPEKEPMSKRKRKKLEQLKKKHELKSQRFDVLQELKKAQLTDEQAELMQASHSVRKSKRETVAEARRRIKAGVPLSITMERIQTQQKRSRHRTAICGEKDGVSSDDDLDKGKRARALAPTPYDIRKLGAPKQSEITKAASSAEGPAADAASRAAMASRSAAASRAAAAGNADPGTSAASTAADAAEAAAVAAAAVAKAAQEAAIAKTLVAAKTAATAEAPKAEPQITFAQPLKPVRVDRTEKIEEQRSRLPAVMVEQELVETVLNNDVTLVCGETGCGKSTQVPQFLYEAGICDGDRYHIAVTQPRRVAAISVSMRVGDELNSAATVGYQVRYDRSQCGADMRIKFMTDGILLREVQSDFLLPKYSCIIIDEAHERGVNCDILIGLLSRAVQRRRLNFDEAMHKCKGVVPEGETPPAPPLRLIVMSATLRLCDFTENRVLFPTPPPVVRIDTRTFPCTLHFARRTDDDYIKAAHNTVMKIHKQLPPGTILVFVTGRHEVQRLCKLLRKSSAEARAQGMPDRDEVEEFNESNGDLELLEGSDDEGCEFDDTLEAAATPSVPKKKSGPKALPDSSGAADEKMGTEAKSVPQEMAGKKGKKKRKAASSKPVAADAIPAADAPTKAGHPKTKKRKEVAVGAASAGAEAEAEIVEDANAAEAATTGTGEPAEEEEREFSFKLDDEEEDLATLNPEADASLKEDATDAAARRMKIIRMSKLDKSRTANGVFKGLGFGEGPLHVVPLFAQLPAREQLQAFADAPDNARVVVVATNVAETSVTIPNTRFVVDCGHEKRRKYRAASGVSAFTIERIAKASADQRAGRAGRLGPGHAYRLYSAAAYENHFTPFAPIAMLHTPMDPVLLLLSSLGVPRLDVFPWPTPPPAEAVAAASRRLRALGAIVDLDADGREPSASTPVRCTALGLRLASLPVAPRYARMLLASVEASEGLDSHIIGHACALVAALSIGNITAWESQTADDDRVETLSGEHELARLQREAARTLEKANQKEAPKWSQLKDDAEGLLWLMGGYSWSLAGGEEAAERFCVQMKANPRQMSEAHSLMQQLGSLLKRRLPLEDIGVTLELPLRPKPLSAVQASKLRDCIIEGLIDRVAVARPELAQPAYVCADLGQHTPVFLHNASNVFRHRPRPNLLLFNEIIMGNAGRACMRDCISIDPLALARRAAAGSCSLLKLGEFLPVPAPRYLPDQDKVLAFASPSYAALEHVLPTVEVEVPAENIFRYKVFARALLEGEVLAAMPPTEARLLARPPMVLQAPNNPRVLGVVGPLWQARVGSRAELLNKWQKEPRFLLEGYLKWLDPKHHDDVRAAWPPSGLVPRRR